MAQASTEYHVYYIRGGYKPQDPNIETSFLFWSSHLKYENPHIKQTILHNFDKQICPIILENYWNATEEGKKVKIAILGFSWGGPEAFTAARCLADYSIDVDLIVLMDSIVKFLIGPAAKVPNNVKLAINFFSRDNGMFNLFNVKKLWSENGETQIFTQRIDGKVDHAYFLLLIEDCVLNILFNFVNEYKIRNKLCTPKYQF